MPDATDRAQTVEEAYEAHRRTLPADNGALPWAEAGWALRAHWIAVVRERDER